MDFDASLLVVMGAFWVAYWIIRTFYINPMTDLLVGRHQEVSSAREVYESALAQSEVQLEEQRNRFSEARLLARQNREEVRREAMAKRHEMLDEAKSVAATELDRASLELHDQVREQRTVLEDRARQLADEMTRRLLGRAV